MEKNGSVSAVLHPEDAAARKLSAGDTVRVYNARGAFEARLIVNDLVRPGVVMSPKGYWPKLSKDGANANATVEERDSDMGHGAVYHDNSVEIAAATVSMVSLDAAQEG